MLKFYVYLTTNLVNNKTYIGVHETDNIANDSYIGSGTAFKQALLKYGRANFRREILAEFQTRDEAHLLEASLVTEEFIKLGTNYNLTPGGKGGGGNLIKNLSGEERSRRWKKAILNCTPASRKLAGLKAGNTMRGRSKNTHSYLAEASKKISLKLKGHAGLSAKHKQRWIDKREACIQAQARGALKTRGRTKENHEGRRRQAESLRGRIRPDISKRLTGLTKENCEWRAQQAKSVKLTMLNRTLEEKAIIAEKSRNQMLGNKNPMYGKTGELSPVSKYTNVQRCQARKLFDEGISRKQIAELTGINYQTVKHIIQAHIMGK